MTAPAYPDQTAFGYTIADAVDLSTHPEWRDGQLNPLTAMPGLPADIAKLISQHTKAFFAWRGAVADADHAAGAVQEARNRDEQARVDAYVEGTEPPDPQAPAAQQTCDKAAQKARDLAKAVTLIEARIKAAAAAHAADWDPVLKTEQAKAGRRIAAAIDDIQDAIGAWGRIAAVRIMLVDPRRPKSWHGLAHGALPEGVADVVQGLEYLRGTVVTAP